MSRRKSIKNSVKLNMIKNRFSKIEQYIINSLVVFIFILFVVFYNNLNSLYVSFYSSEDIQGFNVDTVGLKYIYNTSLETNIELEKLLVMYARENNYFSEDTYVSEFDGDEKSRILENLKFTFFSLNSENKNVYNFLKSLNEDIQNLPFNTRDFESITAINCFSLTKGNYGTLFLEKEVNSKDIEVLSVTDGVVESVSYNGTNGLQVIVVTENKNRFVYANLSKVSSKIKKGEKIASGDTLGTMGNTEQLKDRVAFERSKLNIYIVLSDEYFGEKVYINPYPFLYLTAIEK